MAEFTKEDIDTMSEMLDNQYKIFVGSNDSGLPEIQSITPATHCGYGVFKSKTDDYEVLFDGGNGMSRLPSGKGYTILSVHSGDYPYDFEAVRETLLKLRASL